MNEFDEKAREAAARGEGESSEARQGNAASSFAAPQQRETPVEEWVSATASVAEENRLAQDAVDEFAHTMEKQPEIVTEPAAFIAAQASANARAAQEEAASVTPPEPGQAVNMPEQNVSVPAQQPSMPEVVEPAANILAEPSAPVSSEQSGVEASGQRVSPLVDSQPAAPLAAAAEPAYFGQESSYDEKAAAGASVAAQYSGRYDGQYDGQHADAAASAMFTTEAAVTAVASATEQAAKEQNLAQAELAETVAIASPAGASTNAAASVAAESAESSPAFPAAQTLTSDSTVKQPTEQPDWQGLQADSALPLASAAAAADQQAVVAQLFSQNPMSQNPMVARYFQAPTPPELAGNRLAGTLISFLATLSFALLSAGVIIALLAFQYPASTLMTDGVLPQIKSVGFIVSVATFFVFMILLVLINGRAGWWSYILGSIPLAVLVWIASAVGYAFSPAASSVRFAWNMEAFSSMALIPQALIAGVLARECCLWYGAWIGWRGRKVTAKNKEALAAYEEELARANAQFQQVTGDLAAGVTPAAFAGQPQQVPAADQGIQPQTPSSQLPSAN